MANEIKCPKCGSAEPGVPVKFTIWGGLIGPRMLHHVACPKCGAKYNGRSGQSNTRNITLFICIPLMLGLVLVVLSLKRII